VVRSEVLVRSCKEYTRCCDTSPQGPQDLRKGSWSLPPQGLLRATQGPANAPTRPLQGLRQDSQRAPQGPSQGLSDGAAAQWGATLVLRGAHSPRCISGTQGPPPRLEGSTTWCNAHPLAMHQPCSAHRLAGAAHECGCMDLSSPAWLATDCELRECATGTCKAKLDLTALV